MTEETMSAPRAKAPWHLWAVGVVSALWNGFGVYDYVCTKLQGAAYLRSMGMSEPLIAHYEERGLLHHIDGTSPPSEVHEHVRATISTLKLEADV